MGRLITIPDQISEVRREIAERERAYPQLVADGKLDKTTAERRLDAMRAVLSTLQRRG